MPKILTIIGLTVSALMGVVFAFDLALGFPFRRANTGMDIAFIFCGAVLAYLSWTAMREQS